MGTEINCTYKCSGCRFFIRRIIRKERVRFIVRKQGIVSERVQQ